MLYEDGSGALLGRSLHWERGLKPLDYDDYIEDERSLPSLGAWIETWVTGKLRSSFSGRSLHWERGLKQMVNLLVDIFGKSLPSLGAWIETIPLATLLPSA